MQAIANAFPAMASVGDLHVPQSVALPVPALLAIAETIVRTLGLAAAIGLFLAALRGMESRRWLPPLVATAAIFLANLDSGITPAQAPLMLLSAASLAFVAWLAARFFLGRNLLAYPLTIALALLASNGAMLLQNHRPDLIVNGVVVLAAAAALLLWVAAPAERSEA